MNRRRQRQGPEPDDIATVPMPFGREKHAVPSMPEIAAEWQERLWEQERESEAMVAELLLASEELPGS